MSAFKAKLMPTKVIRALIVSRFGYMYLFCKKSLKTHWQQCALPSERHFWTRVEPLGRLDRCSTGDAGLLEDSRCSQESITFASCENAV
jgi:hypothetical protein